MLTDPEKRAVLDSWRLVVPIADTAGDLFYDRLFVIAPEVRGLFPEDMSKQKRKLLTMLAFIVKSLDWTADQWKAEVEQSDDLCLVVLAMGRRHAALYHIPDESYAPVGEALLWTLDQGLGQAFTPEVRAAWAKLYGVVATTMKLGARAAKIDPKHGEVA